MFLFQHEKYVLESYKMTESTTIADAPRPGTRKEFYGRSWALDTTGPDGRQRTLVRMSLEVCDSIPDGIALEIDATFGDTVSIIADLVGP